MAFLGARPRPVRFPSAPAAPTFSNEVIRLFAAHCQSCHHTGGVAPFALQTFSDARLHAPEIKLMTQSRTMPPWKPVTSCSEFDGERTLSQNEIDLIARWVDAGAPEGDRAMLPPPVAFPAAEWALGREPDLVLSYPEAYTPPATGDMYRCFTIPTNLDSDRYVSAIDVLPGNPQAVHHVIAYIDTTDESVKLDEKDPGPGYTSFGGPGYPILDPTSAALGGWAPGAQPVMLPDGVAMALPARSRVVLQVHYHPHEANPKPDQTRIGIYFAKTKPTKLLRILPLVNQSFTIPPGAENYQVTAAFTVPFFVDAHLWEIAPHMHLLGRRMSVQASTPGSPTKCLIDIDDWDFNWQGLYRYKEPVAIPRNTTLSLFAYFDNSENNLRNPNIPPQPVSWGESTTDEMCIAFLGITLDQENLATTGKLDTSWMR
jgi:hypothetical protein